MCRDRWRSRFTWKLDCVAYQQRWKDALFEPRGPFGETEERSLEEETWKRSFCSGTVCPEQFGFILFRSLVDRALSIFAEESYYFKVEQFTWWDLPDPISNWSSDNLAPCSFSRRAEKQPREMSQRSRSILIVSHFSFFCLFLSLPLSISHYLSHFFSITPTRKWMHSTWIVQGPLNWHN